jgi:uroporphyrinogen decarboxylase
MMNSRELTNALLRQKKGERVGLMDGPWADTIVCWVAEGYPTRMVYKEIGEQYWRRSDGRGVDVEVPGEYEEPVPPWMQFNYDMAGVGPWFDVLPLRDYDELISETDEWDIRRNGAGASLKYWKHKSGTPEHMDFLMKSREIWERDYRSYLLGLDTKRVDLPQSRKSYNEAMQANKWTHFGHMFIWEIMRQSMGDFTMYTSLITDPGWIRDFNRVYTDFYKTHFKYMFENIGLPDGVWIYEDMGYKNGLFASPKVLADLIFPFYRELNDFFHSYDLPVVLHTCGSTAEALPLIVDVGFDGLHPMERKAKNNDPFAFAEQYRDKLAFIGGLDVRILETNDKDLIRKEMIYYMEGMKSRGAALFFASDHSLPPDIKYDTYLYALDVYREHMWY